MLGEIGDWVFSEENRKESMLLADRQKILENWHKVFGDLEKTCGEIRWRFGENMFGDLEKTCSAIWRKRDRRFGENMFGDLKKTCSAIWRKHVR